MAERPVRHAGRHGCHDWAQFYIAPYGWLFADRPSAAVRTAWATASATTSTSAISTVPHGGKQRAQADFDPPKTQLRIDPFDNQRGEAEYADVGHPLDGQGVRLEDLEMKKLS